MIIKKLEDGVEIRQCDECGCQYPDWYCTTSHKCKACLDIELLDRRWNRIQYLEGRCKTLEEEIRKIKGLSENDRLLA